MHLVAADVFTKELVAGLVLGFGVVPLVDNLGRNDRGEVGAVHLFDRTRLGDQRGLVEVLTGGDYATHDAVGAQVPDDRTGVDLGDDGNAATFQVLVGDLGRAPVGADRRKLARDQALDHGPGGLGVGRRGAVVSDVWIGENDDLSCIGRIGEDLLVAGQ